MLGPHDELTLLTHNTTLFTTLTHALGGPNPPNRALPHYTCEAHTPMQQPSPTHGPHQHNLVRPIHVSSPLLDVPCSCHIYAAAMVHRMQPLAPSTYVTARQQSLPPYASQVHCYL